MNFNDLAWGSFVFERLASGNASYERLAGDQQFLTRLRQQPTLDDFQRLREFLVNFGVRFAPTDLAEQHLSIWPRLETSVRVLAGSAVETCNFGDPVIQDAIASAYAYLQWPHVWGSDTVASKVLHFFNVSLFVMWDTDIQFSHRQTGIFSYLEFLQRMQQHALEAGNDFQRLGLQGTPAQFLSQQLGYGYPRPMTKFLDDYSWVTITRQWPTTIPGWLLQLNE